jgi:hypothetical protein
LHEDLADANEVEVVVSKLFLDALGKFLLWVLAGRSWSRFFTVHCEKNL